MVERSHVVEAVGQLDQDDPCVVAQRQQHLAEIFRLRAGARIEHARHLGQSVHDVAFPLAEQLLDVIQCQIRVFNRVVEQGTYNRCGVQPHLFRYYTRHADGVVDVRFSAFAPHVLVGLEADVKRLADGPPVCPRLAQLRRAQQPPVAPEDFLLLGFEVNGRRGHGTKFGNFQLRWCRVG